MEDLKSGMLGDKRTVPLSLEIGNVRGQENRPLVPIDSGQIKITPPFAGVGGSYSVDLDLAK